MHPLVRVSMFHSFITRATRVPDAGGSRTSCTHSRIHYKLKKADRWRQRTHVGGYWMERGKGMRAGQGRRRREGKWSVTTRGLISAADWWMGVTGVTRRVFGRRNIECALTVTAWVCLPPLASAHLPHALYHINMSYPLIAHLSLPLPQLPSSSPQNHAWTTPLPT